MVLEKEKNSAFICTFLDIKETLGFVLLFKKDLKIKRLKECN